MSTQIKNITIDSDYLDGPFSLKTVQFVHALGIVILPMIGLIAALLLAWRVGITWLDMGLLLGMYVLTIIGITDGFHRHFSHGSFAANTPVRVILAILGSMAAQGSVIYWVSNHRRHHQYTDLPGDPHSPYCDGDRNLSGSPGFWHAHMGWTFNHALTNVNLYAKDLIRDPILSKVNQMYYLWVLLGLLIPTVIGGVVTGTWLGALSGFLWGGLVRLLLTYHAVNAIDSVTHIFGVRPYTSHDYSVNNPWMGVIVLGEGWHNNHHTFPNSAMIGLEWWQIDMGGWLIQLLAKLGWAWDVKVPTPEMKAAKRKVAA
jgi:stearoyl-CoA desaturase (delta-9 desaturase)